MEAHGTKETVLCFYEIKFLLRSKKLKNGFIFPEIEDIASASENDIVRVVTATKTGSSDQTTEFGAKLCSRPKPRVTSLFAVAGHFVTYQ